jgi:transposase-like protein
MATLCAAARPLRSWRRTYHDQTKGLPVTSSCALEGLDGVKLAISDAHTGLKQAIAQVLGAPWQRCTVHFLRDMLGHVTRAQQPLVSGAIRGIFTATTHAQARERLGQVADQLRAHTPKVAALLEDAEAELLAFYAFPDEHWPKLRSTNPLERVNREIGRRYLSETSMALVLATDHPDHSDPASNHREAAPLTAS